MPASAAPPRPALDPASRGEVALLRVVAQRLAGPRAATAAAAVAHLAAMQAQDLAGAARSVSLRVDAAGAVAAPGASELRGALAEGAVVRSWPMRGTLHLVPAADLSWMLSLTRDRMEAGAARRREQLGIDAAAYARAERLAVAAIEERGPLTRAELIAVWRAAGLVEVPGRAYHLLTLLSWREVLVQGPPHPTRDSEQLFVLSSTWIPSPVRHAPEEALAVWAEQFFRSHGPATVADFARWTGLPVGAARRGLAAVRTRLSRWEVDGGEAWLDPATPDLLAAHRAEAEGLLLLPGFDELVLGYADRTPTLAARWSERVVPGNNGVFRPTVVHRGSAVGTWARVGSGRSARLVATPFEAFDAGQRAALAAAGVAVDAAPPRAEAAPGASGPVG